METVKQLWIYTVLLLSVGPDGPKGGIYPIMEDVLCRVNFLNMIWRPNKVSIYAFLLMSVVPVGPGGGIYSL